MGALEEVVRMILIGYVNKIVPMIFAIDEYLRFLWRKCGFYEGTSVSKSCNWVIEVKFGMCGFGYSIY